MTTESVIVTGTDTAKRLAAFLVGTSIWFSVEPLPDRQYVFTVKAEDLDRVIAKIRNPPPG
jgi:hypothetical protein